MQKPFLIQRLQKSFPEHLIFKDVNDFSFGCGYKNGGLSSEIMKMLKPIFRFDYMGSAEFEFGALPKAFQKLMLHRENNVSSEITCTTQKNNSAQVYIICKSEDLIEISAYLQAKANNEYMKNMHTKERVGLQDVINKSSHRDVCGWIELDTGFMFFTDKEMFEKTKFLFGVK